MVCSRSSHGGIPTQLSTRSAARPSGICGEGQERFAIQCDSVVESLRNNLRESVFDCHVFEFALFSFFDCSVALFLSHGEKPMHSAASKKPTINKPTGPASYSRALSRRCVRNRCLLSSEIVRLRLILIPKTLTYNTHGCSHSRATDVGDGGKFGAPEQTAALATPSLSLIQYSTGASPDPALPTLDQTKVKSVLLPYAH